jgi:hypothetical protein
MLNTIKPKDESPVPRPGRWVQDLVRTLRCTVL